MSELKHTPEHWKNNGGQVTAGDEYIGYMEDFSDEHISIIIACVNACAGMADPAQEIATLRANVRDLLIDQEAILKSHTEEQERADKAEAEVLRLRGIISPFEKFAIEMKKMGGNFPKTGTFYRLNLTEDSGAEITIEDFQNALANAAGL